MKKKQVAILILLAGMMINTRAQAIEKTFTGWWAMTNWTFEFHKDNLYSFSSSGHAGNIASKGMYKISGDTIITSETSTNGSHRLYLLESDSVIIDLSTYYEYRVANGTFFYNSQKRYDILKKPNMDSMVVVSSTEFDSIVKACIHTLSGDESFYIDKHIQVDMIRCINTIRMSRDESFKTGIYKKFIQLVEKKEYEKTVSFYYNWIPNKGMGFYFHLLQVELDGTPQPFSMFTIQ
jgi:hypothetical protein